MAKKLPQAELDRMKADFDAPSTEEKKHPGKGNPNGRPPSLNPRTKIVGFRLSETDRQRLDEAARILDTTKTKVIVEGIETVYLRAKKEERQQAKQ